MAEFTVEVQRTSELILSEPRALGALSRTAVTPRNPREEGKGEEARGLTDDHSSE
jgi:hypothetical protein